MAKASSLIDHETNMCQYCGHALKDSDHPLKEAKDKGGYRSLLIHVEEDIFKKAK